MSKTMNIAFARRWAVFFAGLALLFGVCRYAVQKTSADAPPQETKDETTKPLAESPAEPVTIPEDVSMSLPGLDGKNGAANAVIAQVNDDAITWEDVLGPMRPDIATWRSQMSPERFAAKMRYEVSLRLQEQINRRLVLQQARTTLTEEEKTKCEAAADEMLNSMIADAGSREKLAEQLKARALTINRELATMREDLLIQEFLRKKIGPQIYVTRRELLDYYESLKSERYDKPTRVRMRLIVLKKGEFASRDAALGLAEAIEERARAGEDFEKLARRYSHGIMASKGGLWEYVQKGSFKVKEVDEALFSLPQGGVSEIIETADAFYIVQAADRQEGRVVPFTEVQKELEMELREQKFNKLVADYVFKLYAKSYVNIKPLGSPENKQNKNLIGE